MTKREIENKRKFEQSRFSPIFRHFTNVLCDRIKVNNLPEEIDEAFLLYHVLLYGRILFFTYKEKYHVMWFSGAGEKSEYYIQNNFRVTNPYLTELTTWSEVFNTENAVILYSDINAYIENADVGFFDMIMFYTDVIQKIDESISIITKNSRLIGFLTGSDNSFIESARVAIDRVFNEATGFAIMEESLVDSIKVNPISDKMDYKLSELIKLRQYYVSDFYQKIGVASNMNMKKERLTDNESQLVESVANVDFNSVIDNLNKGAEKINKMFNLNISFELNEEKEDEEGSAKKDDKEPNNESMAKEKESSSQRDKSDDKSGSDDKGDEGNA